MSFWSYVIGALQTVAPGVGATAMSVLESPQPPAIEPVLTTLINDLNSIMQDVVLVLDDYHVVEAREIHDGITFLLAHLPPHLHLVIASRADPPLPLARLRARGKLVEVRVAELRFRPDEATSYLNGVMGLQLHRGLGLDGDWRPFLSGEDDQEPGWRAPEVTTVVPGVDDLRKRLTRVHLMRPIAFHLDRQGAFQHVHDERGRVHVATRLTAERSRSAPP